MQGNCSALPPVRPEGGCGRRPGGRAPSRILRPYGVVVVVPVVVVDAVVVAAVVVAAVVVDVVVDVVVPPLWPWPPCSSSCFFEVVPVWVVPV